MGDYQVPAQYLLSHISKVKILKAPKITNKTLELGCKYSPDFVCMPFKYTLGTFLECLEMGANVLIQAGGGCRYGYYFELQMQILKDLGYSFTYINLVSKGKENVKKIYQDLKQINPKLSWIKLIYHTFIASKMVKYMDHIDHYIRKYIGFEEEKGSFLALKEKMLSSFAKTKGYISLYLKYKKYQKKFKKIPYRKVQNPLRIGIIGELYTIMEPFANYQLELMLASYGISIKRYTNVHYLLFEKSRVMKKEMKKIKQYVHYPLGADAADNVARTLELCQKKYDGIIHIKSSFCTPEIGVMPIIDRIAKEYGVPILYFSFDSETSEVGMQTRIEAFYDLMERKRKS